MRTCPRFLVQAVAVYGLWTVCAAQRVPNGVIVGTAPGEALDCRGRESLFSPKMVTRLKH